MPADYSADWKELLSIALAVTVLSLIVPIGIFIGRTNIRLSRREIVVDLERLFSFATVDGRRIILPSFELVKYKYDPETNPKRDEIDQDPQSIRFYFFSGDDVCRDLRDLHQHGFPPA